MSSAIASSLRAALATLSIAVLATAPAIARAQQPAERPATDKALAEALFREGKKLFDTGKIPEACARFEESQRVDPKLGTLLNLATCHEKQGKTASAWAEFTEAASLAAAAKSAARESFARDHAADLERRLSKLVLEIDPAAGPLSLTLNDKPLSAAATGLPIPVDPGSITIEASAPGKQPWKQKLTIEPGPASKRVAVPKLVDAPKAPPPAVLAPAPATAALASPSPDRGGLSGARIAGIVVAGVGLVGVGVGAAFGVRAFDKKSEEQGHCGPKLCDQKGLAIDRDAHLSADVSTASFAVGLAALAGGAALFLFAPSGSKISSIRIAPQVSASGASITVGGSL